MFRTGPHTLALADLFAKASIFLLIPYLTSTLDPHSYGKLSLYQGIFQGFLILSIFSSNGLIPIIYTKQGLEKSLKIRSASIYLLVLSNILLFLASFVFDCLLNGFSFDFGLLFIVSGLVVFHSINLINLSLYRVSRKYLIPTVAQVSLPVIGICATWVFFEYGKPSVSYRFFAMLLALVVANFLYQGNIQKAKSTFKEILELVSEVYSYGLGLLFHHVTHWLKSYFDRFVIATYLSVSVAGIYSLSMQLTSALVVFFSVVSQALQPYIYSYIKEDNKEKLRALKRCYMLGCSVVTILFVVLLNTYFELVFSVQYYPALQYFNILIFGAFFQALYFLYSHELFFNQENSFLSVLGVVSALVHVSLVLIVFKYTGEVLSLCYIYVLVSASYFFVSLYKVKSKEGANRTVS